MFWVSGVKTSTAVWTEWLRRQPLMLTQRYYTLICVVYIHVVTFHVIFTLGFTPPGEPMRNLRWTSGPGRSRPPCRCCSPRPERCGLPGRGGCSSAAPGTPCLLPPGPRSPPVRGCPPWHRCPLWKNTPGGKNVSESPSFIHFMLTWRNTLNHSETICGSCIDCFAMAGQLEYAPL